MKQEMKMKKMQQIHLSKFNTRMYYKIVTTWNIFPRLSQIDKLL